MLELSYDIYRQLEERKLRWVARVENLDQARERIDCLELSEPGEYLIYDFRQRIIVRIAMRTTIHIEAHQPLALAVD